MDATFNPEATIELKGKKLGATASVEVAVKPAKKEVKSAIKVVEDKAPKKVATKKASKGDDLKKIEGVGPKIAELLSTGGFDTFAKLSEANVEDLQNILDEAGSRYTSHNPTTWPQQAALAAADKWEELKELQDKLNGGRPE
ncbi:helix-hairpin-helix domain-containing protein [Arcticibacterium luteifluviistationis]|uniref:helix-hairpin-helix domain-containing protein n=1 Tax=Arcticibacterium luteifluviistationis TaxID=1784714 RepID=UPI0021CEF108|nr:helix-hairpin-helix domain-containing protein [Arcticibacterium luteifluviistationis]